MKTIKPKFAVEIWQYSQPVTIGVRAVNAQAAERAAKRIGMADHRVIRGVKINQIIVRPAF